MPIEDVRRFEADFLEHLRHNEAGILSEIRDTRDLSSDNEERLVKAIATFKKGFTASDGSSVVEHPADAMDADEVGHESVTVNRPAPKK